MEEENYRVFKTIDNMPRILFWGADQFTIIFAPIFLGIVIGGFFCTLRNFFRSLFRISLLEGDEKIS